MVYFIEWREKSKEHDVVHGSVITRRENLKELLKWKKWVGDVNHEVVGMWKGVKIEND